MLTEALRHDAFALIRRRDEDEVLLIGGQPRNLERISEISEGERLVLVPFAQIKERGFEAHDDGTPLTEISVNFRQSIGLDQLLAELPDDMIEFLDPGGFETSDEEYADLVARVIGEEIGQGEGANVVIARRYRARLADWNQRKALSVFARLLREERGAYWTFLIFTGDRYLIGASPERHVSLDSKTVRMNPISGTFRINDNRADLKAGLLNFLTDEKEIFELFMVVDEELKMMCDICHEGGLVLGPFLKEMSQVVHTEYLLAGKTQKDAREVLRDSMFAATVTGSPVENACRVIKKYETEARGYYSAVAALMGSDEKQDQYLDAPILIRTAEIDLQGNLSISAGATLVRDSNPQAETEETKAKASGILRAFGLGELVDSRETKLRDLLASDEVLIALGSRNQRLSQFWLTDQSTTEPRATLNGKRAVILDAEDDFVKMLSHVLNVLGLQTTIIGFEDYREGDFDGYDLVVIGPGPGDPRDHHDPKIARIREIVSTQLKKQTPMFAVCLGHQILSDLVGLELDYKDIVFQGTQSVVEVLGSRETVGFYNTFVAKRPSTESSIHVEADGTDVHLLSGEHFVSVQFHAESILSQHGDRIIGDVIESLLARV